MTVMVMRTVVSRLMSSLVSSVLLASPGLAQPLGDRGLDAVTAGAAAFPDWLLRSPTTSTSSSSSNTQAGIFDLGEAGLTGSARLNEFRSVVQFLGNRIVVPSPTRP